VPSAGIGHHVYVSLIEFWTEADLLLCSFELTPTLALNNPLLNPVHTHDSNYFPPAPPILHVSLASLESRSAWC